jgi:O-antigen/teichoic acid export membrane protein
VRRYYERVKLLAFSGTAKDTFIVFSGNVMSAFLGFVFTLFVARALSVPDFGVFSAAANLVIILISFTDLGISSGVVNFVAEKYARKDEEGVNNFIKASVVIKILATLFVALLVVAFAGFISPKFLATSDLSVSYWVALVSIGMALPMLLPSVLQAERKFLPSVIADNLLYFSRLIFTFGFMFLARLTIGNSLFSYVLGALVGSLGGILLVKPDFLKARPDKKIYASLVKFSGWIGVNRIISSVSGRLDIQMLAFFAGATATGFYSIPSRLASFIVVLTSSFSAVLAPRLAGFGNKESEKTYIVKSTLALLPIIAGIILWIIIAKPFMVILFGEKYLPSVPVFQALAASMIPFVFTAPSVTAIIYAMKKTVYIGTFSFFQIVAIFLLNFIFIPKYGPIGPTITFGITNTILAIYTWVIVIRHYWTKE